MNFFRLSSFLLSISQTKLLFILGEKQVSMKLGLSKVLGFWSIYWEICDFEKALFFLRLWREEGTVVSFSFCHWRWSYFEHFFWGRYLFYPSHIPIPVALRDCKKGCCYLKSIPLIARTLHKFQRQSFRLSFSNKYMVFGPGTAFFGAQNPGLLYVELSRMSTLGDSPQNSPFLFFGPNANENRFTNVTHKRGEKSQPTRIKYKSVVMREKWIQFLSRNERNSPVNVSSVEKQMLSNWLDNLFISVNDLDRIICYHSKHNKSS